MSSSKVSADQPSSPSASRDEVAALVRAVYRHATIVAASVGETMGRNPTDVQALRWLDAASERPTMGDLARALGLSSAATTGLVDRLEHAALARRVPDPVDRRRIHVEITEHTHRLAAPVLAPLQARIAAVIDQTDAAGRKAVAIFLRRLLDEPGRPPDSTSGDDESGVGGSVSP